MAGSGKSWLGPVITAYCLARFGSCPAETSWICYLVSTGEIRVRGTGYHHPGLLLLPWPAGDPGRRLSQHTKRAGADSILRALADHRQQPYRIKADADNAAVASCVGSICRAHLSIHSRPLVGHTPSSAPCQTERTMVDVPVPGRGEGGEEPGWNPLLPAAIF